MKRWLPLLALVGWPALAGAQPIPVPQTWPLDAAQSEVRFSVRKFWLVPVHGTFPALVGTLRRAPGADGTAIGRVDATLDVASLRMADAGDRRHALGADFFDAARYPVIRFESEPFPFAELAAGGALAGTLDLHGVQHPVAWVLEPSACPQQPVACPIRLRGDISRAEFGMHGVRGVISDRVKLDLRIVLQDGD